VAVVILISSRFFFLRAVRKYKSDYDEAVLELSDYTVLVTGIPEHMSVSDAEAKLVEYAPDLTCLPEHNLHRTGARDTCMNTAANNMVALALKTTYLQVFSERV
jgi:hypothetical protein